MGLIEEFLRFLMKGISKFYLSYNFERIFFLKADLYNLLFLIRVFFLNLKLILATASLIVVLYTADLMAEPDEGSTLNGYVSDVETGETLIGASVYIPEVKLGAYTNKKGFFAITGIPDGEYTVRVSYLGYEKTEKKIKFSLATGYRNDFTLKFRRFFL